MTCVIEVLSCRLKDVDRRGKGPNVHISPYVVRMMDVYVWYCKLENRKMMQFEARGLVVASTDDDETSGN